MSTPNPTDPTVTPARPGEAASFPSVVLEVLREMREQRQSFERSAELAAKERKAERRWRNLFQAMFFGAPASWTLRSPTSNCSFSFSFLSLACSADFMRRALSAS